MKARIVSIALLALLVGPSLVAATGPQIWLMAGVEDFAEGDATSVTIDGSGAIRLAPLLDEVMEAPEPRIWAMTAGGGSIYLAIGERGRVLRHTPGGETRTVFEAAELGAQALAWGPDGQLYVAAGPRGGVYRVPPDHDGSPLDSWFVAGTTYIWDLAWGPDGKLYVATGDDGRILKVDADGESELVYDSPEPHVTTLAFDEQGRLLAGTDGEGLVYRIDASGDVFVLYDSPMREITDLLAREGTVWAAAFGGGGEGSGDEPAVRASRASNGGEARGAVYRIDHDGYAREMWRGDAGVYALASAGSGVLAGTGSDGSLVRIGEGGAAERLARSGSAQVVALERSAGRVLVAASNPGRLLALGEDLRAAGEYLSTARDAGTISRWGTIRWHERVPDGSSLEISTRSGNTGTPDDTWSDWSEPYEDGAGSAITSPPARFLQWRARLAGGGGGGGPRLHRVEIAYVTRNLSPAIAELVVHPAGVVYRQNSSFEDGLPFAQLPPSVARALRDSDPASVSGQAGRGFLGRPFFLSALQTFTWEASDPNDDLLSYRIEFRAESESRWKPLAGPLSETQFVLDTRRLADGVYVIRLTASDEAAHASAEALSVSEVSRPFRVDNTAPEVVDLQVAVDGARWLVRGVAIDRASLVGSIQYSVDGADWRTVVPVDGVADSARESIVIALDDLPAGEHVVVVRVSDTALNEGAGRIAFES